MPQMAPMNWTLLFFMFTLIIIIINTMNFFTTELTINQEFLKKSNKKMNWKW
uniref:ATP synthase complex subunit 8 n=1 Tax=Thaumaglossa rufocapillata TaxID=3080387 RepID=A0AA97AT66_9COLE|nr:ATP synthase F0 subunit 8 [Thaumaglossa rufocapillata]WNZ33692.1 ATP synthase F0 subunit 8 [Thaumaglossa rufocapillata]WRK68079.1 ATP synthase F0 subunit 8 [Thaumaglossa rufocapillata]